MQMKHNISPIKEMEYKPVKQYSLCETIWMTIAFLLVTIAIIWISAGIGCHIRAVMDAGKALK